MSSKTVYIQVDKICMEIPDNGHFIYSEEVDLIRNLTSTFSEGCLKFHDYPGLSTYKTYQQQDIINLCTTVFDRVIFLENELSSCRGFTRSVQEYENAN